MRLGTAARAAGLALGVLASGLLAADALAQSATPVPATPVPEPPGYRLDDYRAPVPATVTGGRVLTTDALRDLLARQGDRVILVDVVSAPRRPAGMAPDSPWMPLPHTDLPGSVWLPDVGRGALNPLLEKWFQQQLATLSGGDKSRPLVFYCLPECWMSWNATKRAASYGYTNVAWYPDGVDGWRVAGLPLATATALTPPEAPGVP
ncbi:PQQ-dependent catabolism-associated CXXCW motif protein [Nitrospirillum sp. BR 11828]|uniref:PQQ-dependent catabolism-associated CXXCW motif protein n=1 Tax=Nitrospirillum sp. BR 11828 TaxID=3104325 RepID=UPI002ACAFE69|nr:PQQ-dependent catabolism-associated CXXCW motif protein [Nitrospirillum sp. BR 11828]MDZ5645919.1 PQQ-dependent catabolism-associated CXXCW motif protein [Nitrospirillum sp. BR 11828]